MNIQTIASKVEHLTKGFEQFAASQAAIDRPELDCGNLGLGNIEHKMAFGNYLRKGETQGMETKSLSTTSNGEGGYLITPALHKRIITGITSKSPMRKLASVENISTNALDVIIQDGEFDSGWVVDAVARVDSTTPQLKQKRIMVHELYAQPKATQRLLDDSAVNVEDWLNDRLQESFLRTENRSFISGDGNNQPTGILHYDDRAIQRVDVATSGEIKPADILKLMNSLDEAHLSNATMLMHRSTLAELQKLQDNNGRFIWQPALSESIPETLFGIPVACASDMPAFAAGAPVVAIANFKAAYKIVDRSGIAMMRDPYTDKPFVKFYAVKRVGGDVIDPKAIKFLRA
ncbi:MAG: phage major capsid protein [Pseudomonadota bacterium]